MFEPFTQISNPEARAQDGKGLGSTWWNPDRLNPGMVVLTSVPGEGATLKLIPPTERLANRRPTSVGGFDVWKKGLLAVNFVGGDSSLPGVRDQPIYEGLAVLDFGVGMFFGSTRITP